MIVRALTGTPTVTSPAARSHAVARIVDLLGRLQRFGPGQSRPKVGRQSRWGAASHRAAEQGSSCVSARANRLHIRWAARLGSPIATVVGGHRDEGKTASVVVNETRPWRGRLCRIPPRCAPHSWSRRSLPSVTSLVSVGRYQRSRLRLPSCLRHDAAPTTVAIGDPSRAAHRIWRRLALALTQLLPCSA